MGYNMAQTTTFDPDKYLAEKVGSDFDPDKYLAEKGIDTTTPNQETPQKQGFLNGVKEYAGMMGENIPQSLLGIGKGVAQAGINTISSLNNLAALTNPMSYVKGTINAVRGKPITEGVFEKAPQPKVLQPSNPQQILGEPIGELGFDIGTSFIPMGLASKSTNVTKPLLNSNRADNLKDIISNISGINKQALEKAASSKDALNQLKEAGINANNGGIESLTEDVQNTINNINSASKTNAYNKIDQLNNNLDKKINENLTNAQNFLNGSLGNKNVNPGSSGMELENALNSSKENVGSTFGNEQKKYIENGAGSLPLNKSEAGNSLQLGIDNILENAGYNNSKFRGVEKFGNSPALPEDIKDALYFRDLAGEANNTADALNQLRLVRKLKGASKPDGSFYNSQMLNQIDRTYQDAIANQLKTYTADNGINENLVDLWRANNERYSNAINAINGASKDLGINKINSEDYISRIKNIGVNNLLNIKNLAATDENITPLWQQLQAGFKDDLIAKSINQNGNIDIKALEKNWANIDKQDPMIKKIMLGENETKNINSAIENYKSILNNNTNLIETTKAQTNTIKNLANNSDIGNSLSGLSGYTRIKNIGNLTASNKDALNQLKLIDQFTGNNFADQALNMYQAKQLGITVNGKVPNFNLLHTGKSLLGSFLGLHTAGLPGMFLGAYTQSPAGAITAYRILNKLSTKMIAPIPTNIKASLGVVSGLNLDDILREKKNEH